MIKRISTENGECWAIVLHPTFTLEDVRNIQEGLIDLMITATQSDLWDSTKNGYYETLSILQCFTPTHSQAYDYERHLKQTKQIS